MINKTVFTILEHLGGIMRLKSILGAYDMVYDNNSIQFKFKGNEEINAIKVIYRYNNDTYKVKFYKVLGIGFKLVEELDGVYCEDLISEIEKVINLCLTI